MLRRLFNDERGMLHSVDYLFLTSVLAIGCVVGLALVRDKFSLEATEAGAAVDALDQSFVYVVPGAGYDPTIPFDPENPQGYTVSSFENSNDIPANLTEDAGISLQFSSLEQLGTE